MLLADLAEKYNNDFEIISSGGVLHVYQNILSGPHTRIMFENIRVDMAFISATAIDVEAGITADSVYEAEITRTILEKCSKKNIGLIYSSKFGKTSFVKVSSIDILDEIITDTEVDQSVLDIYAERGITITRV
jgi:DeoR/GlpR family transcriptional regulator of sugar metabolism